MRCCSIISFGKPGSLRFLQSNEESWPGFVQRQAAELHTAIEDRDFNRVDELLALGGVHIKSMVGSSTILPLHRAAFSGETQVVRTLLCEILDSWPEHIKQEYLDCRTALGFTPFMIASTCGFSKVAQLLANKGCNTDLTNFLGKTGRELSDDLEYEIEQATVKPWSRGDRLSLTTKSLDAYLSLLEATQLEDVRTGIRVWDSKQIVYHYSRQQMEALESRVEQLLGKNHSLALHFTDLNSCRLILNGLGIRASTVVQLGGGVSVCLRSLVGSSGGKTERHSH